MKLLNLTILTFFVLTSLALADENIVQPGLDLGGMTAPTPKHSMLIDNDWYTWGASMVRTSDGTCHLFYTRWPRKYGFLGWLKYSDVAYATSDNPGGPYKYERTVLQGRGAGLWDEEAAHNPHVKEFDGKYYLYYISHRKIDLGLSDWLNHIFTQRIGVAVAGHPSGPWERLDEPIIDLQEGKAAHGYVVNPSVTERPDGGYLMMFKSRPEGSEKSREFKTIHCIATSESPVGPFVINDKPVLTKATAEDPYIWYQDDRYYAVVKDMYAKYTGFKSLALFESEDGFDWTPSENILVSKTEIAWDDGSTSQLQHLERPQLWFDESGIPRFLFCAAAYADTSRNRDWNTFNVHIPLNPAK